MTYDPTRRSDRVALATTIERTLLDAGFYEEFHGDAHDPTKEKTFTFALEGGIRIVVYTSIVGDQVRETGKDAIRVALVYTSERLGKERGIGSQTRVHRVGEIEAIKDRLLGRMRAAWKAGKRPCRCGKCGAPTFKSKNGNDVCADLCWKSTEELAANDRSYRASRPRRRRSGGYRRRAYRY